MELRKLDQEPPQITPQPTEELSEQVTTIHHGNDMGPTMSQQERMQAELMRGPKLSPKEEQRAQELKREEQGIDDDLRKLKEIQQAEWQKAHAAGKDTSFLVIYHAALREFEKKYGRPAKT